MFAPGFKVFRSLLLIALICSVLLLLPHGAYAAGPTHTFYGTVRSNGTLVGAGYVVAAMVNGKELASATTDDQGKWGVSQPFTVAIGGCALIDFYVNGELIGSASSCIETNELNLTVSGHSKSSISAPFVASTNAPGVSGMADSQASEDSTDSGSSSLSSTTTFFIGPQPSSISSPLDSPFSQPSHTTVIDPRLSSTDTSLAEQSSEVVLPSVAFPIAKTGLQDRGTSTVPAAGTAVQVSVIEILVMSAIVIWGIIIVIVFLLVVRKRSYY